MPLRFFAGPTPNDEIHPELMPAQEHRSAWRTGLLLVTSAAFGGIAVAIWNRRTLALMRQQTEAPIDPLAED